MKRKVIIILTIVGIMLLTSCSKVEDIISGKKDSDQDTANANMEKVVKAIENKDKDGLRLMFSEKAIDQVLDINKSIDELIDYFKGTMISYNDWGGPMVEECMNGDGTGRNWKYLYSSYDVETSEGIYRIYIQDNIEDSENKSKGMWSLYIIKMEDDINTQLAYWGDTDENPGINIGIKNVLPKEDPSLDVIIDE